MRSATRVIQVCGVVGLIVYPGYGGSASSPLMRVYG